MSGPNLLTLAGNLWAMTGGASGTLVVTSNAVAPIREGCAPLLFRGARAGLAVAGLRERT